jgi:hypothetical protein
MTFKVDVSKLLASLFAVRRKLPGGDEQLPVGQGVDDGCDGGSSEPGGLSDFSC